jgi:glycosyltransferase involved in cell wall biosynthesis
MAREYKSRAHDVAVVTSKPPGTLECEDIDGVLIHRLSTYWLKLGRLSFNYSIPFITRRKNLKQLRDIFEDFRPEIVHQNGQFFDLTLVTTLLAKQRNIPRVLTIHTPLTHTSKLAKWLIATVDKFVLAPFARTGTTKIFAVDKFTRDLCNDRYFKSNEIVSFIPATLDPDTFVGGEGSKIRARLGLEGKKVILSFGHVIPIRNRVTLIKSLPEIIKKIPNIHVLVVGEVYDSEFLEVANKLNVAEYVTAIGRIPHRDVPDYLALADVECHDINGHGLGITTFEVMAAGVPVVASVEEDVFPDIRLSEWPAMKIHSHLTAPELARELLSVLELKREKINEIISEQRDFVLTHFSSGVVAEKYLTEFSSLLS